MTSKEALTELYVKIDQISALAIKNSFMPSEITKDVDFIGNTLNQIAKDLEVLEILKNKKVDYLKLEDCIINMKLETPEYYNKGMDIIYCLTQEEYDFIKEWLENE